MYSFFSNSVYTGQMRIRFVEIQTFAFLKPEILMHLSLVKFFLREVASFLPCDPRDDIQAGIIN